MKITLEHVGRSYSDGGETVEAVRDVTLEVADGELFVLCGPSGCGKSTLLELVAGLQQPTTGRIRFGDRVVADPAQRISLLPRQRDVAMVFQSYALYPHMSVFDNIAFPLRIAHEGRGRIREAVSEAAEMLGITALLERRPRELSGGQRQRVAIARALVRRPSVFLLDEPLSNLDAQLRASTRHELKHLQRRLRVTTLHVTHDQVEAMTLGDRIALLRAGSLVQIGTPEELYDRPRTAFAATFLGSPPMNLLPVEVQGAGRELRARVGETVLPLARPEHVHVSTDGRALLGIRPERVRVERDGTPSSTPVLAGRVTSVEHLGREILCHVTLTRAGERTVQALTSQDGIGEGSDVRLAFDPTDLHLFPAESS